MKPPILLLLALLLALPARAATLAEALEQAWARHPQAGAGADLEDAAKARAELARGLTPGPAALSLGYLDDRPGSGRGKREWEVELAVPLWLPRQKAARGAEAEAALAELAAERRALRLRLAGELREAWWALSAAREDLELAQRRVESARALEADVVRRHRAGDLARVDANLARNERLAAQAESLRAAAALLRAEGAWRALTGAPAPARQDAEATNRAGTEPSSTARHPELDALDTSARLAHTRLKLAGETRRESPELALRWLRERGDSSEPFGNAVGIRLTLPFSAAARLRQDTAAAHAETIRADTERARAGLALEQETERARVELDAAERQLEFARERRALIADNLALAEKAFALGESDLAGLLRARATALETEAALVRQRVARDAAVSRLLQTLGVLP